MKNNNAKLNWITRYGWGDALIMLFWLFILFSMKVIANQHIPAEGDAPFIMAYIAIFCIFLGVIAAGLLWIAEFFPLYYRTMKKLGL